MLAADALETIQALAVVLRGNNRRGCASAA
jgi:hypothetical protein